MTTGVAIATGVGNPTRVAGNTGASGATEVVHITGERITTHVEKISSIQVLQNPYSAFLWRIVGNFLRSQS